MAKSRNQFNEEEKNKAKLHGAHCNQSFRRLRKENNELKPVLYTEPYQEHRRERRKKMNVAGKALARLMMKN